MLVRETREPPDKFKPQSIGCRKLYELVVQRNEWTDWHGSTDLVNRATNFADTKEVDTLPGRVICEVRIARRGHGVVMTQKPCRSSATSRRLRRRRWQTNAAGHAGARPPVRPACGCAARASGC